MVFRFQEPLLTNRSQRQENIVKALQFHGREDIRVEQVPEPVPGPGEVKLRNAYSGICGSDLHIYFDPDHSGMDYTKPHPVTGAELPQILGHEFAGEVVAVGEGVDNVQIGDRAAVWGIYYCGKCGACEKGIYNACSNFSFHGVYSHGGGMAEYTTVSADRLHKLPDSLDFRMGALVEPMAVAWHAAKLSEIEAGRTALIVGAGPIGIGIWFALRSRGVKDILISEPSESRRDTIRNLGADRVVDPVNDDLGNAVAEMTGGRGVDFAYDASGSGVAFTQAIASLGARGRLTVVALHEKPLEFNPTSLVLGEKQIFAILGYSQQDYDEVIQAMSEGQYNLNGWVETTDLDGAEAAFRKLRGGQGMKILVEAK